jgi:hypothetical protein
MEAMSLGVVPVVMNYGSEVAELITHDQDGYVVERGDVEGMSERIAELARDRAKLERMSLRATSRSSQFSTFEAWRDEICAFDNENVELDTGARSSYMTTWDRIKRGVNQFPKDSRILIYGGGHLGRIVIDELYAKNHDMDTCIVVDRVLSKLMSSYRHVRYHSLDDLPHQEFDIAVIASIYYCEEIRASLDEWNYANGIIRNITAIRDWA